MASIKMLIDVLIFKYHFDSVVNPLYSENNATVLVNDGVTDQIYYTKMLDSDVSFF